ncbi:MAG: hypothetical protein PWP27_1676 [Clostridiales bacterium]|jgi:NADPH-dependent 2,4-dienoyl-CoA reductase/sulfur reductase-like enzyme|nr:hypothetical protein [Clostridiales bacterium]MDK2933866.1 hypothetical protein [Clostridiales bacterium]
MMLGLQYDVVVIGGGPAGLAAAISAKTEGVNHVLVIERDRALGGILQQCIHPGFGLKLFGEELTGPEYANRFIRQIKQLGIEALLDTMVLSISKDKKIICVSQEKGLHKISAGAIVLAMGCRERTRDAIGIPGTRPAGIYTAGMVQRLINIQGYMVGKKVVIMGSGDIGMIMARRLTLEGVEVKAVVEILPYVSGLTRNKVQCLDDFDIPLCLSHTVINIKGQRRVDGVTIAKVGKDMFPIAGTEQDIACDTLLLSVGLIPENELSKTIDIEINDVTQGPVVNQKMETSLEGIFACGNVVHVNDLVDNVTIESQIAGKFAAWYAMKHANQSGKKLLNVCFGENVRYVVPHKIAVENPQEDVTLYFRVKEPAENARIYIQSGHEILKKEKRIKVRPGEMESIHIDGKMLESLNGDMTISVRKGGESQ